MKFNAKLLILSLSLICPPAFSITPMEPVTAAMITDASGNLFDLNDQEFETFKQLPLIKNMPESDEFNFEVANNPCLTSNNVRKLLAILQQPTDEIKKLSDQECIALFDIGCYFGMPEKDARDNENPIEQKQREVMKLLADRCYQFLEKKDLQDSRLIELKECATDLLSYYPDINAFIRDANRLVAQERFNWSLLLHREDSNSYAKIFLNLDHESLSSLGFRKKIRSLNGIENIATCFDISKVQVLYLHHQEIDDFSVKNLQDAMPMLKRLDINNNRIIHLHKNQLAGINLDDTFVLNLDGNQIRTVENDYFNALPLSQDRNSRLSFGGVDPSLFKDCYRTCSRKEEFKKVIRRDGLVNIPKVLGGMGVLALYGMMIQRFLPTMVTDANIVADAIRRTTVGSYITSVTNGVSLESHPKTLIAGALGLSALTYGCSLIERSNGPRLCIGAYYQGRYRMIKFKNSNSKAEIY